MYIRENVYEISTIIVLGSLQVIRSDWKSTILSIYIFGVEEEKRTSENLEEQYQFMEEEDIRTWKNKSNINTLIYVIFYMALAVP
jgi:hypothetical protein